MAFKNIISSMLITFFGPNKGTTKASPPMCSKAETGPDNGSRMWCSSPAAAAAAAAAECAVCLSSLKGELGTRVLPCLHEFHGVCVERWLAVPHFKNTCPICRFSMEEDSSGGDDHEFRRQECFTEEMVIWFSSFHVAGF
ncbi:hypothetical protein Pfo_020679 [Paulownia fortunei]|nr:hypothetical protein Pfo_020679 [Paulownia fortunei]